MEHRQLVTVRRLNGLMVMLCKVLDMGEMMIGQFVAFVADAGYDGPDLGYPFSTLPPAKNRHPLFFANGYAFVVRRRF